MLEPTDIHCYEPPLYRTGPPSTVERPPPSLPFQAVILESPDACGGPSPALLHSLREHGCRLILAQVADIANGVDCRTPISSSTKYETYRPTKLNHEWFDAVFDKVLDLHDSSDLPRYLVAEAGLQPPQCLCFACTAAVVRMFSDANVGLIIVPSHDKVWHEDENGSFHLPGANIAMAQSPTARQLSWLFKVVTEKFWCVCLWCSPSVGELRNEKGLPGDAPSARERAELTSVASGTAAALGHPPWLTWRGVDGSLPACTVRLGDETLACPDWTPLVPLLRASGSAWPAREVRSFPKVLLYCHSLDVGIAQINHTLEAEDANGVRVRVSGRRFVNLARGRQAAAELSVTLSEGHMRTLPDIIIRSSLRQDHIPSGFHLSEASVDTESGRAVLTTSYANESGDKTIEVKAWHRLMRDDGRGDVQLTLGGPEGGMRTYIQKVGSCAVDVVFSNPRRGTRYTVEKMVCIAASGPPMKLPSPVHGMRMRSSTSIPSMGGDLAEKPLMLPEVMEEHLSAWRGEWDKADIEINGTRKAVQCQRATRLFRYHQVSNDDVMGAGIDVVKVPDLVKKLFQAAFSEIAGDGECLRPSALITSRLLVQDPRTPPMIRIEPHLPPACRQLRFNAALGRRWHRFTFTSGAVKILVQGPILGSTWAQPYGDIVRVAPRFTIPSSESDEGLEVRASPWHEVHVQHALTDLGRPDGSTGGFYSLMRRTRFMRHEVLRRLLTDSDEDYRAPTLQQILRHALAGLRSVPRPPEWCKSDNKDLHILDADATTRARVQLAYEKDELIRDIIFLEGKFTRHEGRLVAGEDLQEGTMTLEEAKERCSTMVGCRGFTFQGDPSQGAVKVFFRDAWGDLQGKGWTSFQFHHGEAALEELLQSQHEARFRSSSLRVEWVDPEVPAWDDIIKRAMDVLRAVGEADESRTKPFRNLITDRDGTTNNYCDRYASSIQSAYNAAWLSHFARHCTDNAVVITAAPLGGRPSAEGLLELSVAPRGTLTYTGSKGREYFNHALQRVLEAEELPQDQRELIEELHRRLLALCSEPRNTKFLGIGSGLQRKFGEVTMARNDPAHTVPEPESRRFMAAVRHIKEELDPDGTELDFHDTGTDMEIFPHVPGGRTFDKGSGVMCLNQKLQLHVADGPNIVCGDTSSDIPLIVATLRLMCGDHMVDVWQERLRREEEPAPHPEPLMPMSPPELEGDEENAAPNEAELEQRLREEAERRAKEEEDELKARESGAKLAVFFVVPPVECKGSADAVGRMKKLTGKVQQWCELSGAHFAILPSPDVLVAALAHYANYVAGNSVTGLRSAEVESGESVVFTPKERVRRQSSKPLVSVTVCS